MTNAHNTTLYVGATTNIRARLWEHKNAKIKKAFTARYNLFKLVYFESFSEVEESFLRERFIKGKSRKWKEQLINRLNPSWSDLGDQFLK